jgi:putative DNA primase/helicase
MSPKAISLHDPRLHSQDADPSDTEYVHQPDVEFAVPDLTWQGTHGDANKQRFLSVCGGDVHYLADLRQWALWNGRRWQIDSTGLIWHWAGQVMREFYIQAGDVSKELVQFATRSRDASRIREMLTLTQHDPAIAIQSTQFDRHRLLINLSTGTYDLATDELRPWRREDLLTQLIDVPYDPRAECPTWTWFLSDILAPELLRHLQKGLGHSLSGDPREKVIFVCHGAADAGKTTMLSIIRELLGEYASVLRPQTLLGGRDSNAQSDLATLRGRRFVHISEFQSDEQLAQAVLKNVCQGSLGRSKAVPKYANAIDFAETWRLWLDTNALPKLRDPYDPGMWVRLHVFPFPRKVPDDKIDRTLQEKLRGEFPGILAWLIEGYRLYLAEGLRRPPAMELALTAWFGKSDHLPEFIHDQCVTGSRFRVQPQPLYESYQAWCKGHTKPMPVTAFSRGMEHHGFARGRVTAYRFYQGLKLKRKS